MLSYSSPESSGQTYAQDISNPFRSPWQVVLWYRPRAQLGADEVRRASTVTILRMKVRASLNLALTLHSGANRVACYSLPS